MPLSVICGTHDRRNHAAFAEFKLERKAHTGFEFSRQSLGDYFRGFDSRRLHSSDFRGKLGRRECQVRTACGDSETVGVRLEVKIATVVRDGSSGHCVRVFVDACS